MWPQTKVTTPSLWNVPHLDNFEIISQDRGPTSIQPPRCLAEEGTGRYDGHSSRPWTIPGLMSRHARAERVSCLSRRQRGRGSEQDEAEGACGVSAGPGKLFLAVVSSHELAAKQFQPFVSRSESTNREEEGQFRSTRHPGRGCLASSGLEASARSPGEAH